jgi:hypothetical protein
MSLNLPTKPPDAPAEKTAENKFDRFRPEMPQIPGVRAEAPATRPVSSGLQTQRLMQIGLAAAVILMLAATVWWTKSKSSGAASTPASATEDTQPAVPAPSLPDSGVLRESANVAGTVDELSKPWASKKFVYVKPFTRETVDAMVIRLPSGELWAFSLQGPLGRCELEYATDPGKIASQYRFNASHPMVVSPCDGTVYDPLKVGPLGGNTWARGEIVKGNSLRPPISIDVKVVGRSIVADNIE